MGEYTVQASILVRLPAADVLGWLTTPDLMTRWMVGADKVEPLDATGAALGAMTTVTIFAAASISFGQAECERLVAYDLVPVPEGTGVTCTARTIIPGLPRSIKDGHRSSTKPLQRSLDHLAACAEGRSVSSFGDSAKNTGEPL